MNRELWPYQADGLEAIREAVRAGVKRLCVQAPTGGGKTLLAAAIAEGAYRKGKGLAFVVPRISLIDQTVEEFAKEGITDVGVIQANHHMTDWARPIQVCSIQTVGKRGFPQVGVVMFDEAHELHKAHLAWMEHRDWAGVPFIGLSATPWAKGLGQRFQSLLIMATTRDLIEQGYLSPFRVYAASKPDVSKVQIVAGDYHEGQLSQVMQEQTLTADIIRTYKQLWGKGKTLVFGVDCAHAQMLRDRFVEAGIRTAYQDAHTPSSERAEIKRMYHSGAVEVVCNVDTLTLGIDWDVRCLSLCRPTRSEMRYVQIVGRALRKAEGKTEALILDHSDTTARLGFVTDIHYDSLDMGVKGETPVRKSPLPKPCPACQALMPPRTLACPACGFVRKPTSNVFEADGELVEFRQDGSVAKVKPRGKAAYSGDEKRWFYAQLKSHALERGFKLGWCSHVYKEKFGVWPNGMQEVPPARSVGAEVRQFIRSRWIARARSRADQHVEA